MRQTLREKIKERMALLEIQPKRSLGQNFLVSDSVVERIVAAADPKSFSQVFEVGPGLGALTDHLLDENKNLQVVELDKTFAQFWRQQGLSVHEVDALKYPWSQLPEEEGSRLLVSNLPYQISSRLLIDLSIHPGVFQRMVLMFQKEVAQRVTAQPGTEDYGLLTVVAQAYWNITLVLEAGAVDFMPKPNVASRVLCFDDKKTKPTGINPQDFLAFLKLGFANRRKKLLPKLQGYGSKTELAKIFSEQSIAEDIRIEKLSPQQLIDLYLSLKKG